MTAEIADGVWLCGCCGTVIPSGAVQFRVTTIRLVRCATCVRTFGAALPSVPVPAVRVPSRPLTFSSISSRAHAVLDARQRQAGEREP